MRRLATIRRIDDLLPIEGADLIQLARIDGWQVVVKKHEFDIGDLCIYIEIDSWIPHHIKPELSKGKIPRVYNDIEGERLRTVKLKGQLSQGLALPVSNGCPSEFGTDVSDLLNIQKWEATIPAELSGQVKGNFPVFIKKTDQERCQNMKRDIFVVNSDAHYEVTMKLDGTSFTAFVKDGVAGVCSRNWELKMDDPKNEHNSLVRMFIDSGLRDVMLSFDRDFAVQSELMGPGILKNREAFASHKLFVFDIFNIATGGYVSPRERHLILDELWARGVNREMVHHVPVLHMDVPLYEFGLFDVDKLLAFAEGPSIKHAIREGLVYKRMDGGFSFKVISNNYLLKSDD